MGAGKKGGRGKDWRRGEAFFVQWRAPFRSTLPPTPQTLGLVVAAVYQRALRLTYVDALLPSISGAYAKAVAAGGGGAPVAGAFSSFDATFQKLASAAEASAASTAGDRVERPAAPPPRPAAVAGEADAPPAVAADAGDADAPSDAPAPPPPPPPTAAAIDIAKLRGRAASGRGRGGGKAAGGGTSPTRKARAGDPPKKEARVWAGHAPRGAAAAALDFSEGAPPPPAAPAPADLTAKSLVDDEGDDEEDEEDVFSDDGGGGGGAAPRARGVLASFVRSVGVSLVGSSSLAEADIAPALDALKGRLVERNVAEAVAEQVCASVRVTLVGAALPSLTRVATAVRSVVEAALTRILTPRRSIDVLREVRAARGAGRPYVVCFVGVNGVGKSTSLAKVAYWLLQHGVTLTMAACDTFRSGAVEQLKTHAARLGVPLYERGYEKDPAKVAAEAVRAAARDGIDAVLVDTAGRMQDNEPLMRALAGLIATNAPDLVLFVGEALVGADGVDQLTTFNARLLDLAPPRAAAGGRGGGEAAGGDGATTLRGEADRPAAIDGVVLTKFDTIDDKVGAAVSMVYASGAPIMFVGCGQTYVDLKRLNVKSVVRSLLK